MLKAFVPVLLVLVLSAGALVVAANAAAPGDALYGLDRQVESLRLGLAASPEAAHQLEEQFFQERLAEIEVLEQNGELQSLEEASENLDQEFLAASGLPGSAQQDNDGISVDKSGNDNANVNDSSDDSGNGNAGIAAESGFKQPKDGTFCNGTAAKHHPAGDKLAGEFGVAYEDIMHWFCECGYGFGEIAQAYQISERTGISVEEIFNQRGSGLGWGQIKQSYGLAGNGKPPKDGHPGKPDKPGKNKNKDKPGKNH
jgi:hypothetical protein